MERKSRFLGENAKDADINFPSKCRGLTINKMCFEQELINKENFNTNCKLWIQDKYLFKQYISFGKVTQQNINNIMHFIKRQDLKVVPELVLPKKLVFDEKKQVMGYIMDYYKKTETLEDIFMDRNISSKNKKDVFVQLAMVLNKLPKDIFIGDLHGRNVIVDTNFKIHVIDIDGFSTSSNQMSCPLNNLTRLNYLKKYYLQDKLIISKDTDIACYMVLLLNWLAQTSILQYSSIEIFRYLNFLEKQQIPQGIIKMMKRIFDEEHNFIDINAIKQINVKNIDKYTYKNFVDSCEA
ncbi:Uncharacterized protein with protein kinase and helix-hairpin-helix DNA-binding domains [uncultured Eubacterium sp.]|nr:Uncharacterized protein with protein kinase and helix-hairpin-helix DNA-binding domains [uncultured Eubacterium sp.]